MGSHGECTFGSDRHVCSTKEDEDWRICIDPELVQLAARKRDAYVLWKHSPSPSNKVKYVELQKAVRGFVSEMKIRKLESTANFVEQCAAAGNSKQVYESIKSVNKRRRRMCLGIRKDETSDLLAKEEDKLDCWTDYFSSTY